MIYSHLKFAIRIFLKDKVYSILNVLGLALGITCGILLLLYLQSELTFDQHHERHERIYRFTNRLIADGVDMNTARTSRELGQVLKDEIPEIQTYVRLLKHRNWLVQYTPASGEKKVFYEPVVWRADSSMFSIFTHRFLEGDPKTALAGPGKVVITQSTARKYFGNESPIGKELTFQMKETMMVTGVIEDLPDNSHLKFDFLLSGILDRMEWHETATVKSEAFWNPDVYTYVLMPENYRATQFLDKFNYVYDKYFKAFGDQINGRVEPQLQPLAAIHFQSDFTQDETAGNLNYVYTFWAVGVFIILLACINYMNLATARSVIRTKEIAVRKVLGFSKVELFFSILTEAMVIALLAMALAIGLSYFIIYATSFTDLIGRQLEINFFDNRLLLLGTIGITVGIGVLSGTYPALFIPSISVVNAIKGNASSTSSGTRLRKFLILLQFVISAFVLICTQLMNHQMDYLRSTELGFTKENVILLPLQHETVAKESPALKNALLSNPGIVSISTAYGVPGVDIIGQVYKVEKEGEFVQQNMNVIYAGFDYLKTLGLELLEGRDFRRGSQAEYYYSYIVNETMAKTMGWQDQALGKSVRYFHEKKNGSVIGVVKDFNFASLHNAIEPLFIVLDRDQGGHMYIRVRGVDLPETIRFIRETWEQQITHHPFEYSFLDQEFGKQYAADETQHRFISILSYICIFISLLGLVGLSAFAAGQRIKEIGVRKVLGASVSNILLAFSKEYAGLIVVASLVAVPVANYIIHEWLGNFAYRVTFDWWLFLTPCVVVLILGLAVVSWQSYKAARANPVDALRSDG